MTSDAITSADEHQLGPDSSSPNVPHGTVTKYQITSTKAYPGVAHNYSVYVPAQYDGKTPAAVMVFPEPGGPTSRSFRLGCNPLSRRYSC